MADITHTDVSAPAADTVSVARRVLGLLRALRSGAAALRARLPGFDDADYFVACPRQRRAETPGAHVERWLSRYAAASRGR